MSAYIAIVGGGSLALALATIYAIAQAVIRHRRERLERILAARKAERVATLRHIADVDPAAIRGTFDALVADVTTSDYGYRSETPTFDRLCADVARRDAAELDGEWEREAGA